MGTTLTGLTPATTYDALIKVGDNGPIDATLKVLSDGLGTNLPMEVSTTGVNLTGSPTVNAVAIANTTQVAAKQDTLVSGTNIKTINGASLLGSGNIPVVTSPSGVAGAIQFSNGSAFASDAANFFWDNTNKRFGVGTNAPTSALDVNGTADGVTAIRFKSQYSVFGTLWSDNTQVGICRNFRGTGGNACLSLGAVGVGVRTGGDHTAVATLDIKGTGSTSATTSLLVQNSAGTAALTVKDDLSTTFGGNVTTPSLTINGNWIANNSNTIFGTSFNYILNPVNIGGTLQTSSAMLEVRSTTRGFLPPVMTTTQRNAIASPAAGLMIYNTTTAKLNVYTTAWEAITSI